MIWKEVLSYDAVFLEIEPVVPYAISYGFTMTISLFDDDGLLFVKSHDDGDELPGTIVEGGDDDE